MGHKKILVFLLSTIVFMTGGTVAVVEDIKSTLNELEIVIEERVREIAVIEAEENLEIVDSDQEVESVFVADKNTENIDVTEEESESTVAPVGEKDSNTLVKPLSKPENTVLKPTQAVNRNVEKKISYSEVVSYQNIDFDKVYKNDSSLEKGKNKVETSGSLGQREITTRLTFEDGVEVKREVVANKVVKDPKNEVILVGTYVKPKEEVTKVSTNSTGLEKSMVNAVNKSRSDHSMHTLRDCSRLTAAAQIRALEIVTSFSHTRPSGQRFNTVDAGWVNGENIAYGISGVDVTHQRFMDSQGHRENILRSNFKSVGVASHKVDTGVIYWVVLFSVN